MPIAFFLCETVQEREYPTGSAFEVTFKGRLGSIDMLVDIATPPEVGRAYRFEVTPVAAPAIDPANPNPPEVQIREHYKRLARRPLGAP